jgi:asparagine synthase (glutamine-hydrolysing)
LRNTIGLSLPKEILRAPKQGFGIPLREWFKEESFSERLNTMNLSMPYLNKETISEILRLNSQGKKDFGDFIWMLFIVKEILEG